SDLPQTGMGFRQSVVQLQGPPYRRLGFRQYQIWLGQRRERQADVEIRQADIGRGVFGIERDGPLIGGLGFRHTFRRQTVQVMIAALEIQAVSLDIVRSEERRVGKEWRYRWEDEC